MSTTLRPGPISNRPPPKITSLLFADRSLAQRIEAADTQLLTRCYEAVAKHLPERPSALLALGGGVAPFVGHGLSLSRAVGLGMNGPVSSADLDALEGFYRDRGADADIAVSPYADRSLFEGLAQRGFHLVELDTLLAQRIVDAADDIDWAAQGVTVLRAEPCENVTWVRASMAGYSGGDGDPPADMIATFEAAFHVPTSAYYLALYQGSIAGTAAVNFHEGSASLFGASTLAAARNRGVQTALVYARLAAAKAAGCDFAYTRTTPGSASQRNLERLGFHPVYSRARLVKRFHDAAPR